MHLFPVNPSPVPSPSRAIHPLPPLQSSLSSLELFPLHCHYCQSPTDSIYLFVGFSYLSLLLVNV